MIFLVSEGRKKFRMNTNLDVNELNIAELLRDFHKKQLPRFYSSE